MSRKSSRSDRYVDHAGLVAAMGPCRTAITREVARMEINGSFFDFPYGGKAP